MNKSEVKILFLGGAKRVSMAEYFLAWGDKHGRKVSIFSYELSDEIPIREKATIIKGRKWAESLLHLKEVILENSIDIVIPFVDPATLIASELSGNKAFSPVSDHAVCSIFFSKINSNTWCLENKIPVPSGSRTDFPLIAKPDKGSASQGIIKINNQEELDLLHDPEQYLIQQFVDAAEYTVDAYRSISHGNINFVVPRIRLETQGGEAVKARTVRHRRIEQLSREIIEKSGLRGAITLQFLEDRKTGEIYFMEVNPRFGGGVVTSFGAGIDIAGIVMADFQNELLPEKHDWEEGLTMLRRFSEIYIHANHH